jgi:hypothetical protein
VLLLSVLHAESFVVACFQGVLCDAKPSTTLPGGDLTNVFPVWRSLRVDWQEPVDAIPPTWVNPWELDIAKTKQ